MTKQSGYTLIEVLIVIAILAALVLMAAPLSGTWTASADAQQAEGQLKEAFSKAKSLAQRNEMAARGVTSVAAVCLDNRVLSVRKGIGNAAAGCGANVAGEQVWQAQLGGNVTLLSAGAALACVCFDNKGLVTRGGTCNGCAASTTLVLSAGSYGPQTLQLF